ncbi:MAG: cob(I)yrinic acid a,c-diamide adenosyltransferase [Candidatus Dojkabacteria bacterium]|nr:cob(I)yrinic acid a,c-diamide adenosyltransferase [Candidatus Dojkabacteria bacterium]
MIIIFTGEGKGKTSAAFGTVLRMLGANNTVAIIQVLKTDNSGETKLLKNFIKNKIEPFCSKLSIKTIGRRRLINPRKIFKTDKKLIEKALNLVDLKINEKPALLILDEILVAHKFNMIKEEAILEIIKRCRQRKIHLILTGRGSTSKINELADLVTNMQNIKHPYNQGIPAIKGIDY